MICTVIVFGSCYCVGANKRKKGAGKPRSLYRGGFRGLWGLAKTIRTTKKAIAKSTENLELSELQLKMISEASFGNLFLMFWYTRFELEHWLKIEDAMTKMLRCYVRGQDPNKLRFVFKRHGQPNELVSTPEEMALIYGMPRIPNREYLDYRLTQVNKKSGWRETEFFKRTFPTDMKAGDKVTRPMIVKAILNILKRTPINLKKKKSDEESLQSVGDQSNEDSEEDEEDEEDAEDLVRLICLYMCTSLFFATSDANALTEKYIGFVLDLEKAKNISWPDLIHSHLEKELNENVESVERTNGCAIYLLVRIYLFVYSTSKCFCFMCFLHFDSISNTAYQYFAAMVCGAYPFGGARGYSDRTCRNVCAKSG